LSLVEYLVTKFPLRRATPARRVIFLPAANSFRGPQFPWVRIFLKTFLLCHVTPGPTNFSGQFLWLSTSPCS
jgi:hypothetical protein